MADIRVVILTRTYGNSNGEVVTDIVRVFEDTEACEHFIVGLVRMNKFDDLAGLGMNSQLIYGGEHGNSKLYVRDTDTVKISQLTDVRATRG